MINLTYSINPAVLQPFVPSGVELDIQDGQAFVSLVAFDFLDTKVKGLKIPFHVNFPEINLRFYVKKDGYRGVVFIKEFVPKFFIAKTAKIFYNEPYESKPMKTIQSHTEERFSSTYKLNISGKWYSISISAINDPYLPDENSQEYYFKEHEWGFGEKGGNTKFYKVVHPQWNIYPIETLNLNWDFAQIYGTNFDVLNDKEPIVSVYAEGSRVAVYPGLKLEVFT